MVECSHVLWSVLNTLHNRFLIRYLIWIFHFTSRFHFAVLWLAYLLKNFLQVLSRTTLDKNQLSFSDLLNNLLLNFEAFPWFFFYFTKTIILASHGAVGAWSQHFFFTIGHCSATLGPRAAGSFWSTYLNLVFGLQTGIFPSIVALISKCLQLPPIFFA